MLVGTRTIAVMTTQSKSRMSSKCSTAVLAERQYHIVTDSPSLDTDRLRLQPPWVGLYRQLTLLETIHHAS